MAVGSWSKVLPCLRDLVSKRFVAYWYNRVQQQASSERKARCRSERKSAVSLKPFVRGVTLWSRSSPGL